ncbi:transposase [Coraliomargarita parva]|uniref:transposase n=1 Tax=Coraliomargarita parva TaxID=3014050 RepID=UPI0022B3494F|nr:transposase [Coraliomargarita parva]
MRRLKVSGCEAVYHCMTRTVNGESLFGEVEKEVLRKMLHQVADFCGVQVLTYCIMGNHFHVLLRVPDGESVGDAELMRRYRVLYPRPTKYQAASAVEMARQLAAGGEEAVAIRSKLLARMGDVSEYMKTVKQRFSVWFNRRHGRYGTLWSERFKSVLVEGKGNPLQTMAAYIDLNPVRAGLVSDPKDYRFCGYAEAVAGQVAAQRGLQFVWSGYVREVADALRQHRMLLFGKGSVPAKGVCIPREQAVQVLEQEQGKLPKASVLRCRVRYFTDGAILGSQDFVQGFAEAWQAQKRRKYPPRALALEGADWGDLAVINPLRRQVFS